MWVVRGWGKDRALGACSQLLSSQHYELGEKPQLSYAFCYPGVTPTRLSASGGRSLSPSSAPGVVPGIQEELKTFDE